MVTEFNNARLPYQNFTFGPDDGRIYSIDHEADVMYVKDDPAGVLDTPVALVKTIPLTVGINSEVRTLQYDGYYFWTQRDLGTGAPLGTLIEKWELASNGNTLRKSSGPGSEFYLINNASTIYESEAMAVHTLETYLTSPVTSGSSSIDVDDSSSLQVGDAVYLGPNNLGDREEVEIASIGSGVINFTNPTVHTYTSGDKVIIRKNLWVFNNYNGLEADKGKLYQFSTYTGSIISESSSNEWKDITAAAVDSGSIYFVRDSQMLVYSPLGVNQGYLKSGLLNNIRSNKSTLIKVYDISINNSAISKLQKTLVSFQSISKEFIDIASRDDWYNIEREFFTPKVKSLTTHRTRSVLFGEGIQASMTIEVRDQYNIPVLGRSIAVSEDDTTGFIVPGTESFVTDSLGQGVTIYETGSPEFFQPTITAVDVVTDLRVVSQMDQLREVDTIGFLQQVETRTGLTKIVQYAVGNTMPLYQRPDVELIIPIEQVSKIRGVRPVQQILSKIKLPLEQIVSATDLTFIDQIPFISTEASINQYVFLTFAVPTPYSIKNDPTTNILIRIVGFGSLTLQADTLSFKVNGEQVADNVSIISFPGGLELEYDPYENFPYGSRVYVEVSIEDNDSPPNQIFTSYYFDIIQDFRKPSVSQLFPPHQSIGNTSDTEVYAIIEDPETGIDQDSIELYVEGRLVPFTLSETSEGVIKVLYEPTCQFPYDSEISASVIADDNSGNRLIETWTFYVQQSPGVLFIDTIPENCQVLVPVDIELCSEVFGLEEGVHIDSLTFSINGKLVKYVLHPKVYRKE